MKSFSFTKALTLGCLMVLALPVACGDDETNPPAKAGSDAGGEAGAGTGVGGNPTDGGAGGAGSALPPGLSDASKTEMCTDEPACKSAAVGPVFIDPCCAGDACGLSTGFLSLVGAKFEEECQAKGQVGAIDNDCPTSASSMVPFSGQMLPINGFVGCCRENGKCGVVVNEVVSPALGPVANLGLGCVDAAPFFPNTTPDSCDGVSSGGGAGGAGSGGASGGDGAGGAVTPVGGAGGAGGNN